MAKKCEWNGKPAYEEGPMILQLNDDNKWEVYHAPSKWLMMGPGIVPYKQKKDALAYAQALIARFDMNFTNLEEMIESNGGKENCMRLRNEAFFEVEDNKGK